jgi:hypothetical protein
VLPEVTVIVVTVVLPEVTVVLPEVTVVLPEVTVVLPEQTLMVPVDTAEFQYISRRYLCSCRVSRGRWRCGDHN